MVEFQSSKLATRVRFPSPAPLFSSLVFAAILSASFHCRADDGWERPVVMFNEENDIGFSDRHYTQGLNLTYLSRDHSSTNWLTRHVPSLCYDAVRWKWGLELGQQMFTPEKISERRLLADDRPYAGWLYGGLIYQTRGVTKRETPVIETFRLQAGVVGPESQADDAQILWHHFWGFPRPSGWRNQINTEVGVQLNYDRKYRFAVGDVWSLQCLPEVGVHLGNVRTDLNGGFTLRAGYNIPNEFGTEESKRGANPGIYVFGGVYGRAVLIDIFLDGNNFRDSHHVNKEPLVGEGRLGATISSRHLELSVTHVQRTYEFSAQRAFDGFTSLTLTVKF